MARKFAQVKVTIWDDPDFVALDADAQRLYFVLMTRSDISMAGVITWHAGRLAQLAKDTDAATIEATAAKLERAQFIVIDRDTDECLLRTFVRHDDALRRGPLTAGGVLGGWRAVYSHRIKTVIAHAVGDEQGLKEGVLSVIEPLLDWASFTPLDTPSEGADEGSSDTPSGQPTATNQQPTTSNPRADRAGTRISDDFTPDASLRDWAAKQAPHVDVDRETANFVDYWAAKSGKDATKLDWRRTWQKWMRKASDSVPTWKRQTPEPQTRSIVSERDMRPFEGDPDNAQEWSAWQRSERQRIWRERGEIA